jgi:nucleoid-associated protein YgaU
MAGISNNAVKIVAGAGVVIAAVVGLWFATQSAPPPAEPVAVAEPAPTAPAAEPAPAADPAPAAPTTTEAPAAEPAPEAPATEAPASDPAPAADRIAPTLDVVRIEPDGAATIAGAAEAGARVSLRVDGAEVAFATSDGAGAYTSLFTLAASDKPRVLTVVSKATDGVEVEGTDKIVLDPTTAGAALTVTDAGVAVVDGADIANITIDTVTYDGDLIRVGGRGAGGAVVRLYVDNVDAASAPILANGSFNVDLAGVAAGEHTLRADQLDASGNVTSRYEMQITKAAPEALAAAAPAPEVVEIASGTTLWAIAEATFGDGLMYIQVYEANKDKIKDPNLIYPGQVFTIPTAQ